MEQQLQNELGNIVIAKDVISKIAGLAAMECYGLVGMSSQKMQDGLAGLLGKEKLNRGVEININEDQVLIDLYIVVEYGVNISEVANNVIDKVQYTLEEYTGTEVSKINIHVQGVRVDETG
ncbi:Asp23/Gls24 family envelope stress response protein [Fuchsiella alkaliacetigena]|uniref:Asp23/Gls24 family envelope stress response protein n=1 Tax=Fuchsiella alkaliacetigena TaxID=957042 RepID=UPI00200B220A|nr:Asp23/Gls24 family envelope stress response protein [Fuchsiella alkaliacetigena]MCK8823604.1 Asp23/Gls24 family envelope stress response protein [Fuchsiella alkaliacetigena]